MIAKGQYGAVAVSHEHGQKQTGTQFIRLVFKIEDEGAYLGTMIPADLWLTDATIERTMDSLGYTGWDGKSLAEPVGIGTKKCSITIEHEDAIDGSGKKYAKVAWINPPGFGGKLKEENKMKPTEKKSLDDRFKASMMGYQKGAPRAEKPAKREPNPDPSWMEEDDAPKKAGSPDNDEIPFSPEGLGR